MYEENEIEEILNVDDLVKVIVNLDPVNSDIFKRNRDKNTRNDE